MKAADQRAIASGTPEAVLVERAGAAVARHAIRVLGGTYGRRVVVVCGKGNNGGDGRIAATALAAWGARVDIVDLADPVDAQAERQFRRADCIVDAMFGTGFRGPVAGTAAEIVALIASASATGARVVA